MFVNKNKRDCEYSNPHYENNFYQILNFLNLDHPNAQASLFLSCWEQKNLKKIISFFNFKTQSPSPLIRLPSHWQLEILIVLSRPIQLYIHKVYSISNLSMIACQRTSNTDTLASLIQVNFSNLKLKNLTCLYKIKNDRWLYLCSAI